MNMKWIDGMRLPLFLVMFGVAGALVVTGCSEDNEEAPEDSVFVEKVGGDDQAGETGRELPDPIVVRVHDAEGLGVEGATVSFAVTGGGGTVSPSSSVTDPDGVASVSWTLGAPPVWNRVRASAEGDEVEFVAWASPGRSRHWMCSSRAEDSHLPTRISPSERGGVSSSAVPGLS